MHVTLLECPFDPLRLIASAARLCYSNDEPFRIYFDSTTQARETKDVKLVQMLREKGHLSPFEHVSIVFGVDGISRACSHQLVRHRLASYSQRSQRYCSFDHGFVTPPSIQENDQRFAEFHNALHNIRESYKVLIEMGVPKEDARYILPNASETALVVTMNIRELYHFFDLRLSPASQWEIRELARRMYAICHEKSPILFPAQKEE